MKTLITTLFIVLGMMFSTTAQQKVDSIKKVKITTLSVKDTTINNIKYPLYVGPKGGRYIIVTKKDGGQYKKYFPKKQQ